MGEKKKMTEVELVQEAAKAAIERIEVVDPNSGTGAITLLAKMRDIEEQGSR